MSVGFIDSAIAQISATGVAKPSRWYITMQLPLASQNNSFFQSQIDEQILASNGRIQFACETISLPGKTHATGEATTYNWIRKRPIKTEMEDVEATFRVSHDMFERKFFDAWMNLINDPVTRDYAYANDYTVDIDIYQVSDDLSQPVYGIKLQNAYPITMGPLQGDQAATNDYYKQTVTFHLQSVALNRHTR